jgi:hypothetical protein
VPLRRLAVTPAIAAAAFAIAAAAFAFAAAALAVSTTAPALPARVQLRHGLGRRRRLFGS